MVYTEIQTKKGKKYYYRTLTVRDNGKFSKFRKYLGKELPAEELKKKEQMADSVIQNKFGKTHQLKISQRRLYKQSGAGLTITICMPMYQACFPVEYEKGLTTYFPDDMCYSSPDHQFFHYFSAEKSRPIVKDIFRRMDKDPNWINKRVKEFEKSVNGSEKVGEELILASNNFSKNNREKIIKTFEKFLQKNRDYWRPSIFIDIFDPFEKEIVEFIFREMKEKISKEDLQFLFLPDRSVFWDEKQDFEKIKEYAKNNN